MHRTHRPKPLRETVGQRHLRSFRQGHSPRTVAKDLRTVRTPDSQQRWLTFVHNHAQVIVACDFFVVITATFHTLYVFVLMEVEPAAFSITT